MIELCRHIEAILLDNSCVIVPGLGGFVTQYVPARRVDEEGLMFPPYRSVAFNPCLTMNDGLLAQSYMYARGVAYGEALRLISAAVAKLGAELRRSGRYELPGIGALSLNAAGRMEFSPEPAGVIAPELYGLDAFALETSGAKAGKPGRTPGKPEESPSGKHYTLRVNKEFVRYVAAALTAVVFYAVCVFPIDGRFDPSAGRQTASVTGCPAVAAEKAAKAASVQPDTILSPRMAAASASDSMTVTRPSQSAPAEAAIAPESGFTIVLASQVAEKNAKAFVESFVRDGYDDVRIYERGRMRRVVCGTFASEAEAHEKLRRLRDDERFDDGWVMALK